MPMLKDYLREISLRRIFWNISVSTFIALTFLFVTEFLLRVAYPEEVLEIALENRRIEELAYEMHPRYLISLKPGIQKTFVRDAANQIVWKTNEASMRGEALREEPEARIIVYGDSNIQARFSHLHQTFPYKLQQRLVSLTEMDIEVLNAGLVGSGPDQFLLRLSEELPVYRPNIVVFHIFADNDLGDNIRNRLFDLDADGALVETNFPVTVDQNLKSREPRLLLVKAARKVLRGLQSRDSPEDSIDAKIKRRLSLGKSEYAVYENRQPRKFSHFADHYDLDVALFPNSESAEAKAALLEQILVRAKSETEAAGAELIILIQPSTRDLTQNLSPNYQDFSQYPDYRRNNLTKVVDAICFRLGIRKINLYNVFATNDPEELFFNYNDHWNDAGQELAARYVADYIAQNIYGTKRAKFRSPKEPGQGDN